MVMSVRPSANRARGVAEAAALLQVRANTQPLKQIRLDRVLRYARGMITALTGQLRQVAEDRALVACGPVTVEVLVPAADVDHLQSQVGHEITLHTVCYLEGDASGGNLTPRLIGFVRLDDRGFFTQFITVKGIGPRKALKALIVPASEVAAAIETKDTRALVKLPQVGKRAAETIIAELAGKVGRFVQAGTPTTPAAGSSPSIKLPAAQEDAVATLVALGEKRGDAEALLERLKRSDTLPESTDGLVREMLRLRSGQR